jgi:hypothetical protein
MTLFLCIYFPLTAVSVVYLSAVMAAGSWTPWRNR